MKRIILFFITVVLSVNSCVKGSREISLSPRAVSFATDGGTVEVTAKFDIYEIILFDEDKTPVGEPARLGHGKPEISGLQEYEYDWITLSFTYGESMRSFKLRASPNSTGQSRKMSVGVYAIDDLYSVASIEQK